jgi:hypothetical protein
MATPTKSKAAERDKRTERVYKKPPQRRRATKDEPRPRAEAKKRPTRETPATKKRAAVAERDKRTERKYDKPKPTPEYADLYRLQERMNPDEVQRPYTTWRDTLPVSGQTGSNTVGIGNVAPPVEKDRPRPMIRAGVGPVAQLSSQAAHTYGMTPEAYNELASIPTTIRPPQEEWEKTSGAGAFYLPDDPDIRGQDDSITLLNDGGGVYPDLLAHEQAHGWWYRRGMNEPEVRSEYAQRFSPWTQQPGPIKTFSNGSSVRTLGPARMAETALGASSALYPDPDSHPTELYARTVQFSPNSNRQDWPDEVRPYYSGFLQDMDRLQDDSPTPSLPGGGFRVWR